MFQRHNKKISIKTHKFFPDVQFFRDLAIRNFFFEIKKIFSTKKISSLKNRLNAIEVWSLKPKLDLMKRNADQISNFWLQGQGEKKKKLIRLAAIDHSNENSKQKFS